MFKFIAGTMTAAHLQRQVEEIQRAAATPVRGAEPDFGARVKQAVKQRARNQPAGFFASASVSPQGETFGERLKEAVKKKAGATRHKQQADREKARYHRTRGSS